MKTIQEIAKYPTPYKDFLFVYPPRPERQCKPEDLIKFEDGSFLAQPKLNGDNTLLFINGDDFHMYNRRGLVKMMRYFINVPSLYSGTGWMILNGEYMDKSKRDETGQNWNGNFVIFDILAYDGYLLTGSTVTTRLQLLTDLYGCDVMKVDGTGKLIDKTYLYTTPVKNVWRVCSYTHDFKVVYDTVTPIDMYEGLVLKKKDAMMAYPGSQLSNSAYMVKCRKETKIYKF